MGQDPKSTKDTGGEASIVALTPSETATLTPTESVSVSMTPTMSARLAERQTEVSGVTALILANLYANENHASTAGLERLTARNRALAAASNDEILRSIGDQAQLLEALFHVFALRAQDPKLPPAGVEALMRTAFAAERTYLRAVAVLATVKTMRPAG